MLKVAICEDSSNTRTNLIDMLYKIFEKNGINGEIVFNTNDPNKFYNYIIKNHIDLAFLDIELHSELNGIELAKKIRNVNKSIHFIFITAHIEFIFMAFKVTTFDYILKPVSFEKLEECMIRLTQYIPSNTPNQIKIKSGNSIYLVNKNDIVYIEKVYAKSFVYTTNEIIETYTTLEEFEKSLSVGFVRCHKSFIINIKRITKVNLAKNEVILNNSFKCHIGRKYRNNLLEVLKEGDEC